MSEEDRETSDGEGAAIRFSLLAALHSSYGAAGMTAGEKRYDSLLRMFPWQRRGDPD
ncbi:MAG TPA: hypothetical protein VLF18_06835 [Tahibacter sp.]|uniref:hypothetical protein n=1 Tax=Tahibacter sp. TaxID=2056211 RepID=UPI002C2795DF|nr:hypothetical protein [Tahibacter sp.]HSX59896.1 hypothetical protein [Tahibacter sp.]